MAQQWRIGAVGASHTTKEQQEHALDDLLAMLIGVDGNFMRIESSAGTSLTYWLDPSFEPTTKDLCERAIPTCILAAELRLAVPMLLATARGHLSHALGAAIRSILDDFTTFALQLEVQAQKLHLWLDPSRQSFETLFHITRSVVSGHLKGAAVFNLVFQAYHTHNGNADTRKLLHFLLECIAAPYIAMLTEWIFRGTIVDPHAEFLVKENRDVRKETLAENFSDAYWEQRYVLLPDNAILLFSEESLQEKILTVGKYVSVLLEYGLDMPELQPARFVFSLNSREFSDTVSRCLKVVGKRLLEKLLKDEQLEQHLRATKRYFLSDQGDFFIQLFDVTEAELSKPADEISLNRLNTLLEMALRSRDGDALREGISAKLLPYNLINQLLRILHITGEGAVSISAIGAASPARGRAQISMLTGLEAFTLDYRVRWPLTLVLSRKALTKYQLLYRNLFRCKYLERLLCATFVAFHTLKDYELRSQLAGAFILRQKMLLFLQQLGYYLTLEVIDRHWRHFVEKQAAAATVDDLLESHTDFLDSCLKGCMLTDPRLVKIMTQLLGACQQFCEISDRKVNSLLSSPALRSARVRGQGVRQAQQAATKIPRDEIFRSSIRSLEATFVTTLRSLIEMLRSPEFTQELFFLSERLDFNDNYARGSS